MRKQPVNLATITILLAVIAALVLLGCTQQDITGNVVSEGPKQCTEQEAYTVEVPYNDTEYEWVEVCYDRREYCKEKTYMDFTLDLTRVGNDCVMTVRNTGDIEGEWKLHARFITTAAGGGPCSEPIIKTIAPGKTERFEFLYDGQDPLIRCEKTCSEDEVPTVKDCPCYTRGEERKPVMVTKYRTETRYRDVTVDC